MKFGIVLGSMLFSSQVFAAAAVQYNCLGKDSLSGESVVFELAFTDHAREAGYTNQSVTITKKGYETLEKPVVFQMYDATSKNNCTKNELGEIFLVTDLDMTPAQGKIADYTVRVKSDCADLKLDVRAYCLFQ